MRVKPLDQLGILQGSVQTAIVLDSGGFEEAHKIVEAQTHKGSFQSLKRAEKKALSGSVHRMIGPGRQTGWLFPLWKYGPRWCFGLASHLA